MATLWLFLSAEKLAIMCNVKIQKHFFICFYPCSRKYRLDDNSAAPVSLFQKIPLRLDSIDAITCLSSF